MILEPAGAKYRTYRFSYVVKDEEENVIPPEDIDDDLREEICDQFDHSGMLRGFSDSDAIFSLKMHIADNRYVDITVGYFGDRESEVAPKFYEFLKKEINTGWDAYFDDDEYSLSFSAVDEAI